MNRYSLAWLCLLMFIVTGSAVAQQTGTAGGAAAQAPAPAPAAPQTPRPKSKQEAEALQSFNALVQNPATQPEQVDAAVTDFVTKYPTSDFIANINVLAMNYYQMKQSYLKVLEYGEAAIKANPDELYALVIVGGDIPTQVHDTDLDKDQRLAEAEADDNKALTLLAPDTVNYNGHPLPPAAKQDFSADCYESLARVALIRKQYSTSVDDYQKALPIADSTHKPTDYYLLAQAQEGLQKYADASASLDQVIALAGPGNGMTQMAQAEKARITPMIGH